MKNISFKEALINLDHLEFLTYNYFNDPKYKEQFGFEVGSILSLHFISGHCLNFTYKKEAENEMFADIDALETALDSMANPVTKIKNNI